MFLRNNKHNQPGGLVEVSDPLTGIIGKWKYAAEHRLGEADLKCRRGSVGFEDRNGETAGVHRLYGAEAVSLPSHASR